MRCPNCNSSEFHFCDWQDERDDVNRICDICNSRYSPAKETESNDPFDKSNWIEGKIIVSYRYNPDQLNDSALLNHFIHALECDGFGEIIESEIK